LAKYLLTLTLCFRQSSRRGRCARYSSGITSRRNSSHTSNKPSA